MRSVRLGRPGLVIAALAVALLSAACFGGGGGGAGSGQSSQATAPVATSGTAGGPSPVASPARPAGVPSPAASPSPTRAGEQTYTVESGDTLATIAQKFYGDSGQWRKIYEANRQALGDNPDAIKVGTQIRIPPKE